MHHIHIIYGTMFHSCHPCISRWPFKPETWTNHEAWAMSGSKVNVKFAMMLHADMISLCNSFRCSMIFHFTSYMYNISYIYILYIIYFFILFRDSLLCFLNVGTSLVDTGKASWPLEMIRFRILIWSTRCTCSNHDGYDCGNLPSNEEHSSCAKSGLPEIVQVNTPIWKANILFLLPLWLTDCICAQLQGYSRFEGPSCCYRCTMERDLEFMLLDKTTKKVDGNCLP